MRWLGKTLCALGFHDWGEWQSINPHWWLRRCERDKCFGKRTLWCP
jgi:hypothetical protein